MEGSNAGPAVGDPTAGNPDVAQANEPTLDSGLYPGIEQVPADVRQHLDPILKEINTNANKRISEVNQKLESWKPYEELNLQEALTPDEMQNVMALLEVIEAAEQGDPSGFKEWWNAVGNQFQLFDNEESEEGFDEEDEYMSSEQLQEAIQNKVQEALNPILDSYQELEQERAMSQANETIDSQMQELKDEFKDYNFDEDFETRIYKQAMVNEGSDNPIRAGFEELKEIMDKAQGQTFSRAEAQPARPEGPGTPNTNPPQIRTFKDASEAAKARIEETMST